jgi:hypothetical protein
MRFFIVFALGLAAGLFYAWRINPVQLIEVSPDTLREDYQTDYVLMVAEIYHADGNTANAVQRLALLGDAAPQHIVDSALAYARGQLNGNQAIYPIEDLALMQALSDALKILQPTREQP